ncbi:tetratricopeptide repeat protein [Microbispora triticiradicis]|uniref:ATP-binding protein n=2 Tax=Microbispora TaxID=2005 RepID=A0A5R8ZE79_9ACTN|nr:tetratricopeptide repeat protein [Microbispora fusca]TLP64098.1 ATP-binding protein [Microbispora fusca]
MRPSRGSRKVIQQAQAAGLARICQAAGDLIVYGGEEPYRWARWPAPASPPTTGEARAQPSELLRASHALVAFTGRHDLLDELTSWRDTATGQNVAVHLIHGPGGQGKTRLAGHVAGLWRQRGWVVLAAHHRRDRSTAAEFEVPTFEEAAGVLVVVDYAERWDTADLLTLLRDAHLPGRLPVRVLLLARPAGTWWDSLRGRMQRDLGLTPGRRELEPLEQETGVTRAGLFRAARDRFAELLQVPGAGSVAVPSALERHEAYRLVLTVHMAALAAVLAAERGQQPPADPVQVSQFLLARERDHWEAMASPRRDRPLATSPEAMGQIVYTATLTGPLGYQDGKAALARAEIESMQAVGQLLKDHAVCYPPAASSPGPVSPQAVPAPHPGITVLEPLYPDRLGEDFIALSTPGHSCDFPADPWAEAAPARLLAPPAGAGDGPAEGGSMPTWARHAVTTLIEAAHRWPHLARQQLYPLLAAAPDLAVHAGGAALTRLADLDDIDARLLAAIAARLPGHRHIDLDIGAAAVVSRLTENRLADATDPATRARLHEALAIRLSYAGLCTRALAEGHQAVGLWRRLAALNPDAYLPLLADSLNNHANRLTEVGQWGEAVPVSEEAVRLRRELVVLNPDAYLPDLAVSVNNYALRLTEVGRRAEALPVNQEAVRLFGELAALNREAYLPNVAGSLSNQAVLLGEVGRRGEAVSVGEEAVRLYRELAQLNREAHLPGLASSLNNYALRLAEVGRRAEAVPVGEEAVRLYGELAALNRDAYLPDLAGSLTNHAALLGRVGRGVEAVSVGEEAVRLYGELAALNRDAYLPGLAVSLTNQAALLGQVGRGVEAVPVSEEAVRLFGELAALNREAYLPDLAGSLQSNALRLAEVGRRAEAVSVNQEALRLFAELAALNREAYLPDLASSLNNHAALLAQVGRGVEAVPVSEEAVSLYGELAALNRDAHLPDALRSLTAWGYVLIENSRFRAAVTPLTAALLAARELPEYVAQSIIGSAADLLRLAYAGDAAAVADEFRVVTGQEVPTWMKEPPSATEG